MTDDNNELIMTAMGILTHAGDARLHAKKALKHVQALQFEEADTCLQEAKKKSHRLTLLRLQLSRQKHEGYSMNTACCLIMHRTH